MNVEFKTSFAKDLKRIRDKELLRQVREVIEDTESAHSLSEMPHIKKLKAGTIERDWAITGLV